MAWRSYIAWLDDDDALVTHKHDGLIVEPMYTAEERELLEAFEARVQKVDPDFEGFRAAEAYQVLVFDDPQPDVEDLLSGLMPLPFVVPITEVSTEEPDREPSFAYQGPEGLGLDQIEQRGAGVRVAVLEHGWPANKQCGPLVPLQEGEEIVECRPRVAVHNSARLHVLKTWWMLFRDRHPDGLCPDATSFALSVCAGDVGAQGACDARFEIAVARVHHRLRQGDIALVESQVEGGLPVELNPVARNAIEGLLTLGVAVVQPAGNGGKDISSRQHTWTGSILTAAGDHRDGRWRHHGDSCRGTPVHCFAWGRGALVAIDDQEIFYGATSAAAAQIAGAAATLQGVRRATHPRLAPYRPAILRRLLGADATATATAHAIGVMPDLSRIVAAQHLRSHPTIRRGPNDDGRHATSDFGASPDMVVVPAGTTRAEAWARLAAGERSHEDLDREMWVAVANHHDTVLEGIRADLWAWSDSGPPTERLGEVGLPHALAPAGHALLGPFRLPRGAPVAVLARTWCGTAEAPTWWDEAPARQVHLSWGDVAALIVDA